jgi:hypothetical protein
MPPSHHADAVFHGHLQQTLDRYELGCLFVDDAPKEPDDRIEQVVRQVAHGNAWRLGLGLSRRARFQQERGDHVGFQLQADEIIRLT